MVVLGVILFVASGQLDWVWAWVYLGLSTATVAFFSVVLLPGHSDLVAERAEAGPGTKGWDRLLTLILLPVGLAMYIAAGLDQRFGWTGDMPLAAHIVAAVFVLLGYALTYWAMLANHFFATTVRIQSERGHTVVDSGPYRFVRHPGYVGILVYSLAALVLLGSLWALIPGALDVVLYVIRTSLEDKTLQAELPGYKEYAARTRYRLIPGLY
jgi:protein-S-isoprenylcysteine O-methyltransferase Ste14